MVIITDARSAIPDAMRGAAALIVAPAHAWQIFLMPYTGPSRSVTVLGGLATWSVAVFFLLSGMLFDGSINKQMKREAFSLREYYAKARFLRIYPPLVLSVLVTIDCVAIINGFGLYGSDFYLRPETLLARVIVPASIGRQWSSPSL